MRYTSEVKTLRMDAKTREILENLRTLELPSGDWAIFASGPMCFHGLKEHCHDIDIVSRGAAWEKATTLGEVAQADMKDHVVRLFDETIEIFDGWKPGDWDINDLIDSADMIDGFPVVKLEHVLEWKKRMGRVKDIHDIPIIEAYL